MSSPKKVPFRVQRPESTLSIDEVAEAWSATAVRPYPHPADWDRELGRSFWAPAVRTNSPPSPTAAADPRSQPALAARTPGRICRLCSSCLAELPTVWPLPARPHVAHPATTTESLVFPRKLRVDLRGRLSNPAQRRLSPTNIDDLVEAYKAGATISQFAVEFDVHRTTVAGHLDRHGVPRRSEQGV